MEQIGNGRRIEVFEPFSAAFELTKLILFQPFDLGKWLTIGFAAFLSHLAGGGGSFNPGRSWSKGDWNWNVRSSTHDAFASASGIAGWVWPLVVIGGAFAIVLVVVLLWLGARGKFIFTDCIVRNRGAIVEPWREFRKEGNSYFLFSLLVLVCLLLVLGLAGIPLWLPFVFRGAAPEGVTLIFGLILLGAVFLVVAVALNLISSFMIPVMYRRRCGAAEGFEGALAAIMAHPGPVLLYLLLSVVLGLAVVMITCVTTCLTCCITAIPYVGTVILLPVYVLLMSYLLLFVRQFGNDYDAWANLPAVLATASPNPPLPEPPPLQG